MYDFENLSIWRKTMSVAAEHPQASARERIRVAYRKFWDRAVLLSREIQRDLPGLTLHDDTHFEALWGRANQIAGDEYQLTPLEVFALGSAILLHDSANCIAAFPGGIQEIRATPEWRDAFAEWQARHVNTNATPTDGETSEILFETLRALHAERAETLAFFQVTAASATYYLIEDEQLRVHLGALVGKIAASHHWDIDKLIANLPPACGSLAGMPVDWTIRPVLVACLLRCADATQVDQSRTPDFLYGLLRLRNTSEIHWRAQNRIATPLVDQRDPHTLLFTSTRPFLKDDADAWWLAHDALQVANRELQAADSLLRDLGLPPFAINRVRGAESPSRLAHYLTVNGWSPVAAEIKASRVDKVIDLFGGEKLYGHEPEVSVRELIQNAADAIRFRRELEPEAAYDGAITLRLAEDASRPDSQWLVIDDDGIGMSEAVLTGPLIDFGSSYVSSSLVKAERPGLMSKGRKRIGQFGIGFFSCFMVAEEVLVTSRPFDAGLADARTLHFRNGTISRPLLLRERPAGYGSNISTRVALSITREKLAEVLKFKTGYMGGGIDLTLAELVGILCPMLDVDVFVGDGSTRSLIHPRNWMKDDRRIWLKRILLLHKRKTNLSEVELNEVAGLLDFVDPKDPAAGLAAINGIPGLGAETVGSLRTPRSFSGYRDEFAGAIDYLPRDPRRTAGRIFAKERIGAWASDQAKKLAALNIELPRRQYAAQRVATFGGDATPIVSMRLNGEWQGLDVIFSKLVGSEAIFSPISPDHHERERFVIDAVRGTPLGFFIQSHEKEYVVETLEGSGGSTEALYFIPTEKMRAKASFWNLLLRYASERGYDLQGEFIENVDFIRYIGKPSERENLHSGDLLGGPAIKIFLTPK